MRLTGQPDTVATKDIAPSRWVLRDFPYDNDSLADLAKSIRRHGVMVRLRVFENEEGDYELIAGHRRLAAAMEAGLNMVPVEIVEPDGDLEAFLAVVREEALVDNLERQDLTAIEIARALRQLIDDYGYSQTQVARKIGKSSGWTSSTLALLRLVPSLQDRVHRGEIDITVGLALSRATPRVQEEIFGRLGDQARYHTAAVTVRQMLKEGVECRVQMWIAPKAAGKMLGRTGEEIVELCKAGALRHKRKVRWLIDKDDVRRYANERLEPSGDRSP